MSAIERCNVAGIDLTIAEPASPGDEQQTLFCLHGIGGDDTSFQPQLESLRYQYRVIAWNMPGYRQSEALDEYTFENLAKTLLRVLDELGIEKANLVGQSIGGMVAQEFAHRYPVRIQSLVLIATTSAFGGRDGSFKHTFLAARLKPLDAGMGMAELAEKSIPAIVGPIIDPDAMRAAVNAMAAVPESTYRQVLGCLVTFNRRRELETLDCPVCLIAGAMDTNSPAATMKRMHLKIAGSEFHELADAGHLVNLELPDRSNEIIQKFINEQCS